MRVLTIGSGLESEINELSVYGAKKIKLVDLNLLNKKYSGGEIRYSPSAYSKVISEIAKSAGANIIILASATSLGRSCRKNCSKNRFCCLQ
ncbi:MAG: hypothetical protein R2942_13320 [Ignavibacteria bacterium]